ncbi:hypothetical protein [Sphingomonas oligophenolica]|uniref:Uncharacterized protein n=1 Tax=Sphingomonas oligophenolica TaxID=301154 RepID=A0A502CLR5_9SPHN|nr:hypothetical protein [Sphingomonas oligophenolica]TPG13069.1 hypothetical protein EAH84_06540 [Sphingomonas oligophenolica]
MDTVSSTTTLPALADRAQRYDGWTPDRQRTFLEAIAEGHTVVTACIKVGMASSSAYALRRRAAGVGFALGWRAANLLARDKVADTLLARAIDGQVETLTRQNGDTITRHRFDNRLASTMLARLDRFADTEAREATHQAARLLAAEFDSFLDLIDRDDGPARTGLFLAARIADDAGNADLGAVQSLARADRFLRTGHGLAAEIDTSDLDPDARSHWTAEQWARADAAGMLAFAAPAEPARHSPLCPLHPDDDAPAVEQSPVWWDDGRNEWRTRFAAPPDFDGVEDGDLQDGDYSRTLTPEEEEAVEDHHAAVRARLHAASAPERDAWFAALSTDSAPPDGARPASPPEAAIVAPIAGRSSPP